MFLNKPPPDPLRQRPEGRLRLPFGASGGWLGPQFAAGRRVAAPSAAKVSKRTGVDPQSRNTGRSLPNHRTYEDQNGGDHTNSPEWVLVALFQEPLSPFD